MSAMRTNRIGADAIENVDIEFRKILSLSDGDSPVGVAQGLCAGTIPLVGFERLLMFYTSQTCLKHCRFRRILRC